MRDDSSTTADAPDLVERSVYPLPRRVKRCILRRLGRWSRGDYDVRVVYAADRPVFKKVVFNRTDHADRVAAALIGFGASVHVPRFQQARDKAVWVEYVAGAAFDPTDPAQSEGALDCLLAFAQRPSRVLPARVTGHAEQCHRQLAWLVAQAVIEPSLASALAASVDRHAATGVLRIGFDYADPIAANLLRRSDSGQICAIDIKNVRQDALVGLGLAKAHARWLDEDALAHVFARLHGAGLADVVEAFDFIRLFERIERVARQAETEQRSRGGIRKRGEKIEKLAALVSR